jgi:nitroimidazol reductase NimA-like FMN-containing flavoprotein (pyridoxamine 5'-phosphate oxidase superfamily)
MSLSMAMTREEREIFLADLHVGVISIEQPDRPPLTVPIWYGYSAEVGVWIITGTNSLKGQALQKAGRFSLVAQTEAPPAYQYVSVEGPIVETRAADLEGDLRPMAHRYFGAEQGDTYVAAGGNEESLVFVMQPDRWRTVDYRKMAAS